MNTHHPLSYKYRKNYNKRHLKNQDFLIPPASLKSRSVYSIIQIINSIPPGIANAVAIFSTPDPKLTSTTYNIIKKLPNIPIHAVNLLNILFFSITRDIIRLATLGRKNPKKIPGLPCAPWAISDSPAAA